MADNKKYYYIKLKDNYFEQDNIKVLESMENGYIYSLIIIKLYLKSAKNDGKLMMTPTIPYNPQRVDILAKVIGHDVAHVKEAIKLGCELDLITIVDSGEIWLTDIQNFIGKSTTEADRIRSYRKALETPVQMYNKSTPELEIELKKEIEKEIKKDSKELAQAKELASFLFSKCRELDTKFRIGKDKETISSWAIDIEKLIRIDKRDFQEIHDVIEWCKTGGCFWSANIQSGKKLREKLPTLVLQMKEKPRAKNGLREGHKLDMSQIKVYRGEAE